MIAPETGIVTRGVPLHEARAAVIMVHGRGSSPQDILTITLHFNVSDVAYLAPAAPTGSWYPQRFLAPRQANEPHLSAALTAVEQSLARVGAAGVPLEKTVLLGFSQGACLALEYAARCPQRYGGVVGLSGALIGAEDELMGYSGRLDGVPVFLGCSDVDFHIPLARVHHAAAALDAMGAVVTTRIYPNFGHSINMDEVEHIRDMLAAL